VHNIAGFVDQLHFKDSAGTVKAWVDWTYETNRDLVTAVENNFGSLSSYSTLSKYAYGNDTRARRTHAIRTGLAFDNGVRIHDEPSEVN
jgi:hypothetical protein